MRFVWEAKLKFGGGQLPPRVYVPSLKAANVFEKDHRSRKCVPGYHSLWVYFTLSFFFVVFFRT